MACANCSTNWRSRILREELCAERPDGFRMDTFAEILRLLHPDRLLRDPRATGAGVRVAILDSGVERATLEAKFAAQGVTIRPIEGGIFVPDQAEPLPYTGHQSAPHGTTVADIILTIAPQVQLFSADVFGPQ